ncbi:Nn.00g020950.m01.CDS01 [Neocucurbitaria sp. VM-36]
MEASALAMADDDQYEIHEASLTHQIPRDPFDKHIDETVYLEIEERLCAREQQPAYSSRTSKRWSDHVRLYTLLRMLGYREGDSVFRAFEHEQIGDFWLPLTLPILRQFAPISGTNLSGFLNGQRHVMSDSKQMNAEDLFAPFFAQRYTPGGPARPHRYLEFARSHFTDLGEIGKGASAHVLRVRHKLSGQEFACKRLVRTKTVKRQRNQLKIFRKEVKVLQDIRHHHIVSLVASFTDYDSFSLILDPIADNVLSKLLEHEQPLSQVERAIMYCSFNCLATALEFLHANSVRHKDIKPSNILLSEGRVLLCDFGISLEWTDGDNGTTEGIYPTFTRRYAAPEVFQDTPRNSKTDIWSLGCVFLEIISALNGYSHDAIELGESTEGQGLTSSAMKKWLGKLKDEHEEGIYDLPVNWTIAMIKDDPHERIEASSAVKMIHEDTTRHGQIAMYLASCCRISNHATCSNTSIISTLPSISSSEPHIQLDYAPPQVDIHYSSYRHSSPVSQIGEKVSIPVRNSSIDPSSIQRPLSRVRPGLNDSMRAADSATRSATGTSTTTPGTSLRSNSICFEPPEPASPGLQESSDISMHDMMTRALARPPRVVAHLGSGVPHFCDARNQEEHLFEEPFASMSITMSPTMEISFERGCIKHSNTIQIFEIPRAVMIGSRSLAPPVWRVTRRVVLSNVASPTTVACYSFWLPLADVRCSLRDATVTLQWSDCNQPVQGSTYDQREHWSWVYDPVRTNNDATIAFLDINTAKDFLNVVQFPLENGSTVVISDSQEVRIWNSIDSGKHESAISLTNHEDSFSDSRLFIVGQYMDPHFERSVCNRRLNVRLNHVSKPTYHSDLIEKPGRGRNRVARFKEAQLIPTSFAISAPLDADLESAVPPPCLVAVFQDLTGWCLQFFASAEQLKSEKHAMSKKRYGAADVMLWKKIVRNTMSARITFRLPGDRDVWMSGRISASTYISSSSKDATCSFDIYGKQHGRILNISNMAAVPELFLNDPTTMGPHMGVQGEYRRITLRIQDRKHRQKFAELVEELRHAIAENPRTSNNNRSQVIRPRLVVPTPLAQ